MNKFSLKTHMKHNRFEGWYVRVLDPVQSINLAFIFAYTGFKDDPHAFIQVFDGIKHTNTYHRFELDAFDASGDMVAIGNNILSEDALTIRLKEMTLDVTFDYKVHVKKKSAMGFLAKLPLECYQEILIMTSEVHGNLSYLGASKSIDGSSYMEKTYGRNFPKRWFWLEANQFDDEVSLSLSGGSVPTLFFKPFGFTMIIHLKGEELAFGTYNRAKITRKEHNGIVRFVVTKKPYVITINASLGTPTVLKGPSKYGEMRLDVLESLDASVSLTIKKADNLLYHGNSLYSGFEWMV
ncbi:MAG: tocopherol cyclase family protein [Bacillota bacterium]